MMRRRRRRRRIKVASMRLKIEYVVAWGIGIHEYGTFLCLSKLIWVYTHLKLIFYSDKKLPNSF